MSTINSRWCWLIGIAITAACGFSANSVQAQISSDGTLPNNTIVTPDGNTSNITGGTQAGSNLFHSFQQFSVPTGSTAFFNNPADIQNVIGRVTGKFVSNIDGLIRSSGTANLFLINPNGIVFGPNARLDVGGSFLASTASGLKFADGFEYSASNTQSAPLLTISVPIGLQFGSNPEKITLQGVGHDVIYENITNSTRGQDKRGTVNTEKEGLQVKSGQTLGLIGGNVILEGGILKAPSGQIEIVSVGSNQSFNLQQPWNFNNQDIASFGDIQISGKSFVSTTGDGGGGIAIAGRNITLSEQSLLLADTLGSINGGEISIKGDSIALNQSTINSNTYGTGNSGLIRIDAKNITFENNSEVNIAAEESIGNAGEILINADSLIFRNRAGLNTNTYSQGNAGIINIVANSLLIDNEGDTVGFGSLAYYGSTGDAGDININVAGPMAMKSAGIQTDVSGKGKAGTIDIRANSLRTEQSAILSRLFGTGQPGEIKINVEGSLEILDRTQINSSTDDGESNGGNISIHANSVLIQQSEVLSQTSNDSTGNAGEININVVGSFILKNNAFLNSQTQGIGNGGKINVSANSLQIENRSRVFSNTSNQGNAGEININVVDSFKLQKGVSLSTETSGTGNAGTININANSLQVQDAAIRSTTGADNPGQGGVININTNSFQLDNSTVSSATGDNSTGNAGGIQLNTKSLQIIRDANILSTTGTNSRGQGGVIRISADSFQLDNSKVSSATGDNSTGDAGNIQLNINNLLFLRNQSFISTTAGTGSVGGDGGNITINASRGFVVAVPDENSDITANAFSGSGGRVSIKATDIFGIAPLSRQDLERLRPDDLDPNQLLTNDITAISQTNPTLSGTVELNRPEVDVNSGLVELPSVPVDTEVASGCNSPNYAQSSFIITGRGGLPSNPKDVLTPDAIEVDWVSLNPNINNYKSPSISTNPTKHTPETIVEATGWTFNAKGEVVLTANAPTTPHSLWQNPVSCLKSMN
ncbi:MAG: filamentous hemagglutinin N-terminal domain-containing protein [Scytonema sp. PMC 1069.18]|nr:filamentous hemagglutinin N-terminal domain-containing protein [Scytonema sp. PMC 1069.18]MEC4879749.1 filamentous hemagglutinin N-terminal domain-containing protein [Scytonema sp. PMC 1070.18]